MAGRAIAGGCADKNSRSLCCAINRHRSSAVILITYHHATGPSQGRRALDGTFLSTQLSDSQSDSDGSMDDNPTWETDSEPEQDDLDYLEAWDQQPMPRTYEERLLRIEKKKRAVAKHRVAEMRGVEQREAGQMDIQLDIQEIPEPTGSSSHLMKRLKIVPTASSSSELSFAPMFEEEEDSSSDDSGLSDIQEEIEMPLEELEKQARLEHGDEIIDSIAVADDIAEWVDTVLEDAAPLRLDQLGSLASESLKVARKKKDYRSTVLFAALVDFYRWMPRMGRLRAALRVAQNHGRGPAFQRVLAAQARFFEVNGSLKPSHQGRRQKSNGLLDNEGFYMGVQRWLRTLEVGTVNPKLLQRHINETLLPSLSLKKTTVSIRHCQRWLWKLGYRRKRHHVGVYWDGHERKDVKKHRKAYLAELEAFEKLRCLYAEPDMAEVQLELDDDEIEHVVIVHDESTIHSNDYQNNHYWLKSGEQVLKKKGCGRLIMISGFLCERYGLLALTDEMIAENEKMAADLRLAITDSTTVIYPDNKASGDSYWNMEQMIQQASCLFSSLH
ncbi:hypothetical protein C8R44DRAFT_735628 [Mycena epipterygia]|nr:hypothetical protein C8R44DRAFT_735628 [Mycena epipterygia]